MAVLSRDSDFVNASFSFVSVISISVILSVRPFAFHYQFITYFLPVCLSVRLPVSACQSLFHVSLFFGACLYIRLFVSVCLSPPACLLLSSCLFACPLVCTCLFVCLLLSQSVSQYLSVSLALCLSAWLSISLPAYVCLLPACFLVPIYLFAGCVVYICLPRPRPPSTS